MLSRIAWTSSFGERWEKASLVIARQKNKTIIKFLAYFIFTIYDFIVCQSPSRQRKGPQIELHRTSHRPVTRDLPHHAAELKPVPRTGADHEGLRATRIFVDDKVLIRCIRIHTNRRRLEYRLDRQIGARNL